MSMIDTLKDIQRKEQNQRNRMKELEDNPTTDGVGPRLTYSKIRQIKNSSVWQAHVTGNGVTVVCRVKAMCSHFEFVWSSRKISEDAKLRICNEMAWQFWG